MAEVTSTSLTYKNYKVNKKGLYESSKTQKEGFIEVLYGEDNKSVTYHRYVNGLIGRISSIRISEPSFGGTYLNLVLVDGQEAHTISVPLYAKSMNYSYTARLILDSLSKADFSKKVQISFYTKKVDENEYQNMSAFYYGEKTEDGKHVYVDRVMKDEKPERKYKKVGGKDQLIVDDEVNFYYEKFQSMQNSLKSSSEPAAPVSKKEDSPTKSSIDEEDDLPF